MEKETKFLSLYDYLGYAAGGELGKAVYAAASKANQPTRTRNVSNPKFNGSVLLYTREFLDGYFNASKVDDELPF